MASKRWVVCFIILSLVSLAVFAGIMFWSDPLIQYGKEKESFTYYNYTEMYSNPGIAKNYKYDAVLVGTSMVQNTDVKECNDLFGCDMVRLTYSGGTAYNMKAILDVCFASENTIDTVYWEMDPFQLFGDYNTPRFPLPEYLYEDSLLNDLSYLLNLDVFNQYTMRNILYTVRGRTQQVAREGETFSGTFSKEAMLSTYNRPEQKQEQVSAERYIKNVALNLDHNVIPLIEENPDTEFVFFIVPFSMVYWDEQMRQGTFNAMIDAFEYAIERLLEYENVKIFYYQNNWEIVTNLDNYMDLSHYGSWINSYLTQAIANEEGQLTQENYQIVLDEVREYVHTYDFDAIFTE